MVVPSPSPLPLSKAALRQAMRSTRRAFAQSLSPDRREELERQLADVLDPLLRDAEIVGGYAACGDEISPAQALARAAAYGVKTAYPAFDNRSACLEYRIGLPLEQGPWGIRQPRLESPLAVPDLLLVPLIAIDSSGNRIGQGKGHYDRILGRLRSNGSRIVGVGWTIQRIDRDISSDSWDVPLDAFASPAGLELFRK